MELNHAAISTREWTAEPADHIAALLDAERDWWRRHLHWDLDTAWASVEPARVAGRLPGVIASATGDCTEGWSFYLRHHRTLQVGALVSYHDTITAAIVDHMLSSPAAQGASLVVSFTREPAPGLASVLETRGFQLESYRYLELALLPGREMRAPCRVWASTDLAPVVDLIARAYRDSGELRPFAPRQPPRRLDRLRHAARGVAGVRALSAVGERRV